MAGRARLGGVSGMTEAGALDPVLLNLNRGDFARDPVAGLCGDVAPDHLMTFRTAILIKDPFVRASDHRADPSRAACAFLSSDQRPGQALPEPAGRATIRHPALEHLVGKEGS